MDKQKETPKFNFHCYSFNALLSLDYITEFISKGYEKALKITEFPSRVYEKATKQLNELENKNTYLREQLDYLSKPLFSTQSSQGEGHEIFECDDEPVDEDAAKIARAVREAFKGVYASEEELDRAEEVEENLNEFLKPIPKEPLQYRLKKDYGTPFIPEKGLLWRRLMANQNLGADSTDLKKRALYKHLISAFWSDQFANLSFQKN